jgi:hypothetical protein
MILKLFFASLLAGWAGASSAAYTPVNPLGAGNGAERCLAGITCPAAGAYAGAVSIAHAFEIDLRLPAGSLERVDDSLDRLWWTLSEGAALRPLARYARDRSELGVSAGGGITMLAPSIRNMRVWLDSPELLAGTPRSGDFKKNEFPWYGIPVAPGTPFAFVLRNLSSSLLLSSDPSLPGFSNSGYAQDWMVTWRVPGQDLYLLAWKDRINIGAHGRPNDYDYNDYVFAVQGASPVPLPAALALFALGLAALGAAGARRARSPAGARAAASEP